MTPAIFGIAGTALGADERAFFKDADPAGYILFARNCESKDQLRAQFVGQRAQLVLALAIARDPRTRSAGHLD